MRYLFCPLTSPDFLHPLVGLALELRSRGHEVAFATGHAAQPVLDGAGLDRIPAPGIVGDSFRQQPWPIPSVVEVDVRHTEHAMRVFEPDVLVASEFAFGAFIVREREGIPLCVMDMATYLGQRRGMLYITNVIRDHFGLPALEPAYPEFPLMGDLFLLHSVAEMEHDPASLPPEVRLVGACDWEPELDPAAFPAELSGPPTRDGDPVVYVRHRRVLFEPEFWPQLFEALQERPVRVFASVASWDRQPGPLPPGWVVGNQVPRRTVLPCADLVVTGTRSSATMAAVAHGVPSVVIPGHHGQGGDHAEFLERAGCAVRLDPDETTTDRLRRTVDAALADERLRERARVLGQAFGRMHGFRVAADSVEALD